MKDRILEEAKSLKDELITHRRWLHAHAETGFKLHQTHAYVKNALIQMGYHPKNCGKCGIIAEIGSGKSGKTFLLRADMDALPIQEETGLEFACKTGNMHACGHDMHTAMLLGAAKLLKANEDQIQGTVRLMFQPAEEIFQGSQDMIENGVLEDVDAAMMIHVTAGAPLPTRTVVVSSPGISAPAADYFTIRIQGKGCHGAMPQNGVDPLIPAAHILIGLQEIQTRELGDRAVLTLGTISGGSAPNVIADRVEMSGTLRTFDEKIRTYVKSRITALSEGISAAFRAESQVIFGSGCPCLQNDEILSHQVDQYLKEQLGSDMVFTTKELNPEGNPSAGGSEDFAYISQKIPALMVALCAGGNYPLHHPKVVFDEEVLPVGAAVLAGCAAEICNL